jgi:adenylate cyclase
MSLGISSRTFILGLAVVGVIFAANSLHPAVFALAELQIDDLRINSLPPPPPTGSVAIIEVDDDSIATIGRWPWPRSVMANLVSTLSDYHVAVIGMDLIFDEPDDRDRDHAALAARLGAAGVSTPTITTVLGPGNDAALADALVHQGSTYLAYPFEGHYFGAVGLPENRHAFAHEISNPPPLAFDPVLQASGPLPELISADAYLPPTPSINSNARGSAFVDVDADMDGVLRTIPTVIRFRDRFCVPLFLALVSAYRNRATLMLSLTQSNVGAVIVGSTHVPVDELGRMLIDFRSGRHGRIPIFAAADVLDRRVPADALKGKVVLVGVSARGLGDRTVTPLGGDIPGVEVQANVVENVLSGTFIRRSEVTEGETRLIALILGLAMTIAVSQLGALRSAAVAVALIAGCILYAQYRLQVAGAVVGVVLPLTTVGGTYGILAGYRYVTEGVEKRRIRRAFVHYLAPSVVDRLAKNAAELKLGGEERTITVMFADLTGFTVASTKMMPDALTSKVNRYFECIVRPIDATGGYVERFLGDSALAFWNAPVADPTHAVNAVRAAFEIVDNVRRAREEDEARGENGFTIKVGINTGPAVVGNIGSENRYSYTAMGEDVNLAARLESVPPLYGCLIVIGEHTAQLAREKFLMRELDWILVKGAARPMAIYQPIAPLDAATEAQRELVARFAAALEHYRAMRFAEACALWDELVAKFEPAPSPSSIMAERARRFMAEPPAAPWDAVFVLTSK